MCEDCCEDCNCEPSNDPASPLDNLLIYHSYFSLGEPVAISTVSDGGLSLSLFQDDEGLIVGVLVTDGPDLLTAVGHFPLSVVNEERKHLGLEPLRAPEPWLGAESINLS